MGGRRRASLATRLIPPPRPFALLDAQAQRLTPIDPMGCRWPQRPVPLPARLGGPSHYSGHRRAPIRSPIAGTGLRAPPCTASSGNTWRPIPRGPTRPIPWATPCRITAPEVLPPPRTEDRRRHPPGPRHDTAKAPRTADPGSGQAMPVREKLGMKTETLMSRQQGSRFDEARRNW